MPKNASAAPFQLSLFQPQTSQEPTSSVSASTQLWACFFFHRLSLEVLRTEVDARAWVVVHDLQGKQVVYCASQPAREQGISAGMALTAAYALCPELETEWRDESAETTCLNQLADWAGQYSALVSLEPQALLLEIGGSLKLFEGLQAMQARIKKDLEHVSYAVRMAVAPTPQAALLLARCGIEASVNDVSALRAVLGKLKVNVLPVEDKQAQLFMTLGLRTLHDLWRLPKEGLIKRFGLAFADYLDRLLANKRELRLNYQRAPSFSAHWDLPMETENLTFILYGVQQLLPRLMRFMQLRELALNRLQITFFHPDKQTSCLNIGTRQLCRDETHLLSLLDERLNRQKLPAPVLEFTLTVEEFLPFLAKNQTLFSQVSEQDLAWQHTLDQLQTRLGEQALKRLQLLDDHRPEYAWDDVTSQYGTSAQVSLANANPKWNLMSRPLWLLPQPQRLSNGLKDIVLLSDKERIEGGWWDGRDIRRDYYRARDHHGRSLWVFHDLQNNAWYLHGLEMALS